MKSKLKNHPLIRTLREVHGNPRACIFTEPMWGLSMNLCLPYASVYMLAVGLQDAEIGAVATVYMISQAAFSFVSGPLIDMLGRRKSTLIFDFIGWSLPCVFWALAQDIRFFIVGALVNGAMKVTTNAWDCLLIEDADKSKITQIYSLVYICGNMSALFAPISSLLVAKLTLIPAIRILYINAFVIMTAKIVVLFIFSRETRVGLMRMKETKGKSLFSQLGGYVKVMRIMRNSRGMVFAIIIASLIAIVTMITSTFWQVIASQKLGVPESSLPLFAMFRSIISMFFYFTVIAHISQIRLKNPLLMGFGAYLSAQTVLILTPANHTLSTYVFLCASLILEGFGIGMLAILAESLIAIHADANERARVLALFQMLVMAISAPFGWISGKLSDVSRDYPFMLNLALVAIGIIITVIHYRAKPHYQPSRDAIEEKKDS